MRDNDKPSRRVTDWTVADAIGWLVGLAWGLLLMAIPRPRRRAADAQDGAWMRFWREVAARDMDEHPGRYGA